MVLFLLREKNSREVMEFVVAGIVMRKEKNELEYKTHQLIKEKPA